MRNLVRWFTHPPIDGPRATLLLRLMAGGVFFWEGVLKFVYTNQGVGRFTRLGFPAPGATASFVAVLEIVGGAMLIAGLLTRFMALAFVVEMLVAMLSTKIGVYLGTSPLGMPGSPPKAGVWALLHEIRTDYAQLMTCAFLLVAGPGPLSADARLRRNRTLPS